MADEREAVSLRTLSRWLVVVALVLAGLTLYFLMGQNADPVVPSVMVESGQ
jgi:lipopolysaccharide export system protein LptC